MLLILLIDILLLVYAFAVVSYRYLKRNKVSLRNFDLQVSGMLKGGMALAIVLCHLSIYSQDKMPLGGRIAAIGFPVVAVFFFISGYGLMISYLRKGNSYLDSFFSKRFIKLLLPLFVVCTLNAFADIFTDTSFPSFEMIRNQFLYSSPWLLFSWFVYALLAAYILYYVAFKYMSNAISANIFITICVISIICCSKYYDILECWRSTLLAFPIGLFYCFYENILKNYLQTKSLICVFFYLISLMLAVTLLVIMKIYNIPEEPESVIGYLIIYLSPLIITVCLYVIAITGSVKEILCWLGGISYEIYLIHGVVFGHYTLGTYHIAVQMIIVFSVVICSAFVINRIDKYLLR